MKPITLTVGMEESILHKITEKDVEDFANLSGDSNPIHMDDEYAASFLFGKRIAHGFFTASFFSGIFGTKLPGEGSLYVSQHLRFKHPVFIGDVVRISVKVIKINARKKTAVFETKCDVDGKVVTFGEAEIYNPSIGATSDS